MYPERRESYKKSAFDKAYEKNRLIRRKHSIIEKRRGLLKKIANREDLILDLDLGIQMKNDKLVNSNLFTKELNISTQNIDRTYKDKENSVQKNGSKPNYLGNSKNNDGLNKNSLQDSGLSAKDVISVQNSLSDEIELKNIKMITPINSESNNDYKNVNSEDIYSHRTSNASEREKHARRDTKAVVRKKPINIMQKLFVGNI
ncbi:hypothetical protein AYI69_g57 [Smittium culicis]|uniref:Uncharacterized protein n=1 Tax=Smittium culicis TaxID=133412 RepID=A0A1R1YU27_9FUNG|nr:hypothetical protein AYI69_g57 [Smittium culicis]